MTFDKEEYWKRRNNTVEEEHEDENGKKVKVQVRKPLRGQGDTPKALVLPNTDSKAQIGFDENGQMVQKNREYRRQSFKLPGQRSATKKTITKAKRKVLRKKGRR